MFGYRRDGRRIKNVDPIVLLTPYIMPTRADAQNYVRQEVDYEPMAEYIRKKREEGHVISFMTLVIAAYVRTVADFPELNRFIMNKQIYARNRINVSFTLLRATGEAERLIEACVKLVFEPDETIFSIAEKIDAAVEQARKPVADNKTVDMARMLLGVPGLANLVVHLARLLDRYGLLPGAIYDASPFHTSMFITNMASIGMPHIFHHLYNFGNTSQFISLGRFERTAVFSQKQGVTHKTVVPMGIVLDERICGGASYARAFARMKHYIVNPEFLEKRPDCVKRDVDSSVPRAAEL